MSSYTNVLMAQVKTWRKDYKVKGSGVPVFSTYIKKFTKNWAYTLILDSMDDTVQDKVDTWATQISFHVAAGPVAKLSQEANKYFEWFLYSVKTDENLTEYQQEYLQNMTKSIFQAVQAYDDMIINDKKISIKQAANYYS